MQDERLYPDEASNYFLTPGHIYYSREPVKVGAVLGSCVAVCLWDRRKKCGGMNHYIRPATNKATHATAQFGNVAISALIKMMIDAGCKPENMVAQVLGGASRPDESGEVGLKNVKMAREILKRRGIRIFSEDVGGHLGRKIIFDTETGHVAVLKVHNIRESDWAPECEG